MDYRNFFNRKQHFPRIRGIFSLKKSREGTTRVVMFSNFFSDVPDNFFCTNEMYSDFKDSIISSVELYDTKEKIVVDLFESTPSNEDQREFAMIGFRKYVHVFYDKLWHQFLDQLIAISVFMVIGVLLQFYVYGLYPDYPEWILNLLDCFGSVLVWQFVGYWAFEFIGQYREMQRLKQIEQIEFHFRNWE